MSKSTRNLLIAFVVIGVLALLYGILELDSQRVWANLLVNGIYFTFLALCGTFFVALQYVAEAGWSAGLKRIPEAMGQFLPIGAIVIVVTLGASALHFNHLYHWMDDFIVKEEVTVGELKNYEADLEARVQHQEAAATDQENAEVSAQPVVYYADKYATAPDDKSIDNPYYDEEIHDKRPYLNDGFFFARTLIYLLVWILFTSYMRKKSLEDHIDPEKKRKWFIRMRNVGAGFIVFFAVTTSSSAWDWVMSIDAHWYSTLFGWYNFAGLFVSGLTTIAIILSLLKLKGLMPHINENHLHDLGKFVFAFSVFWAYLWFSQFMLIWYGNIPEEVTYFQARWEHYHFIWIFNIFINFVFPFLILMTRDSKRKFGTVLSVGIILIIGHWLDMFIMVMPGTVKANWGLGLLEIGMFLGFVGLFGLVTARSLSKVPLVPKTHPFLEESEHHHI